MSGGLSLYRSREIAALGGRARWWQRAQATVVSVGIRRSYEDSLQALVTISQAGPGRHATERQKFESVHPEGGTSQESGE